MRTRRSTPKKRKPYLPTPEQIRAAAFEIRQGWATNPDGSRARVKPLRCPKIHKFFGRGMPADGEFLGDD